MLGGIQAHAPALSALSSPTINSYKRLHGEGLSPDTANWGEDNRYTYLRIPAERGKATRVELRAGDASANPYLLLAAMLHAASDGITRGLEPQPVGAALPRTLNESLAALRTDATLAAAFGQEFIDIYSAIKQREVDRFALAVTDWEWDLLPQPRVASPCLARHVLQSWAYTTHCVPSEGGGHGRPGL